MDPRIWDTRKLQAISVEGSGPWEINAKELGEYMGTKKGKTTLRSEWKHGKSVTAGYWDPHGRRIVSTSYDDTIRSMCLVYYFESSLTTDLFQQYGMSNPSSLRRTLSSLRQDRYTNSTIIVRQ